MCFEHLTLTSCIRSEHIPGLCNYSSSWMNTTAWCQWFSSKKGRPKHCQRPEDWKMKPSVSLYSRWINSFTPTSSSLREVNRKTLYLRWTLFICAGMQGQRPCTTLKETRSGFTVKEGEPIPTKIPSSVFYVSFFENFHFLYSNGQKGQIVIKTHFQSLI